MGETLVGCAGWSYRDWVGSVYPPTVPAGRWLETYAQWFPIVEIDSTFYAMPSEQTVKGWVDKANTLPDFRFTAKLPQEVTHELLPKGKLSQATAQTTLFLERVLRPLEQVARMHATLVQLPPTFALFEAIGDTDALHALQTLLDALQPLRRRIAVEFRHGSWYEHVGERLVPEVIEALSGRNVTAVQVDGLGSRITKSRTADWSYFRFHGRRTDIPPSERTLSHAPYNYHYTREEIAELAAHVQGAQRDDFSTIVIFNNHYRGQAVHNAMDMLEALGKPRPRPAQEFKRETRLDDFGLSAPR